MFHALKIEPNVKARIGETLVQGLSAFDLEMAAPRLARRLAWLGHASGRFALEGAFRVSGAPQERIVLVRTDSDDMVPVAGFWVGVRGSRVAVRALPDSPVSLEGPLVGEWRRHGPYLLAAGFSRAFHSPAFADGVFLVFSEETKGLRLLQGGRDDFVKSPIAFRSRRSDDLVSRAEDKGLLTLDGFRATSLTRETVWRFEGGRYRKAGTRIVHDRIWAFDRLATAVRLGRTPEIALWTLERAVRVGLVRGLRRALDLGQRRIVEADDGTMGLGSTNGDVSPLKVRFVVRQGRWVVRLSGRGPCLEEIPDR